MLKLAAEINKMENISPEYNYPTFDSAIPIIEILLNKHKYKWSIKAIEGWFDFDDVKQIIYMHLFKKWHLYKPQQRLEPWVNAIISNQMINLSRNVYLSSERPCIQNGGCAFNEGNDNCSYTASGKQCEECPLYGKWNKKKRHAHNIKLPVSLVNHELEVFEMPMQDVNLEKGIINFNIKMEEVLNEDEFKVYNLLYMQHLSEKEATEKLECKPTSSSYVKIKKKILEVAYKVKNEIDFI